MIAASLSSELSGALWAGWTDSLSGSLWVWVDWPWIEMWLAAFVLTQLVETPIYTLAQRRDGPPAALLRRVGFAFLASALTHPVVWFVIPEIIPLERYTLFFVFAEGFAVFAEALLMRALGLRHAAIWALVANASSVVVGYVIRALFGWP